MSAAAELAALQFELDELEVDLGLGTEAGSQVIDLPFRYEPRGYQEPFWDAMLGGVKRAFLVWHRRAGKDKTCWNYLITRAVTHPGIYFYFLPEYAQARIVIWENTGGDGVDFLAHVPPALVARTRHGKPAINDQRMTVRVVCPGHPGQTSLIMLRGTDRAVHKSRGANPCGVVFSEWAYQNPVAFDVIRPILAENNGWALFNTTPQGRNHAFTMWRKMRELAGRQPENYFAQMLTVDDTKRPDGRPVISAEAVERERMEGTEEAVILQEFYCSFDAPVKGAYWGDQMRAAWTDGRIAFQPVDPMYPVLTAWDLGVDDLNAIWFAQLIGREVRLVNFVQDSNKPLSFYLGELRAFKDQHGIQYARHFAPHDIKQREWTTAKQRLATAAEHGINFTLVPNIDRAEGIEIARRLLPRCTFDEGRCEYGISALSSYRRTYNPETETFSKEPLHNWASNGADAFRYLAVMLETELPAQLKRPPTVVRIRHAEDWDAYNPEGGFDDDGSSDPTPDNWDPFSVHPWISGARRPGFTGSSPLEVVVYGDLPL